MNRLNSVEQQQMQQRVASASSTAERQPVPPSGGEVRENEPRNAGMPAEGKLPSGVTMPTPETKGWKSRHAELLGYRSWLEAFLSWLGLMSSVFSLEVKEALQCGLVIEKSQLNAEQQVRGLRLLSFLRQCFSGYTKVEGILNHYINTTAEGESLGFEGFRRVHLELSLQSRAEVLSFRENVLKFRSRSHTLQELIREVDVELHQFEMLLGDWCMPGVDQRSQSLARKALEIPEADRTMVLLRSLPDQVRMHVTLHHREKMEQYESLKHCLLEYDLSTRVYGDVTGKISALKGKDKGNGKDGGKGKSKEKGDSKGKGKQKGKPRSQSREGKGKGDKKGDKGKGKGTEGDKGRTGTPRGSSPAPVRKGLCYRCGKSGHFAKECPTKGKVHAGTDETETVADPEEEPIMMTLRHSVSTPRGTESLGCDRVVQAQTSVDLVLVASQGHYECEDWLVDSGATSHIVAQKNLSRFVVKHRHDVVKCELRAANGELIPNSGVVDLVVKFKTQDNKTGRTTIKPFVLSRCIVADIPFSVLSSFVLAGSGWSTVLCQENSYLHHGRNLKVGLKLWDRAWWAESLWKTESQQPKSPKNKPTPMDVGCMKNDVKPVETKGILKNQTHVALHESQGVKQNVGRLSFVFRGFQCDVQIKDVSGSQQNKSQRLMSEPGFQQNMSQRLMSELGTHRNMSEHEAGLGHEVLDSLGTHGNMSEHEAGLGHGTLDGIGKHENMSEHEAGLGSVGLDKPGNQISCDFSVQPCFRYAGTSSEAITAAVCDRVCMFQTENHDVNMSDKESTGDKQFLESVVYRSGDSFDLAETSQSSRLSPESRMENGKLDTVLNQRNAEECLEGFQKQSEKERVFAEVEEVPASNLDEEIETDGEQGSEDIEMDAHGLYVHAAQGHVPYLATCQSCVRSAGRIPAKRLKPRRGRNQLAADFAFVGTAKILVMLVVATGMLAAAVLSEVDRDSQVRVVNKMMKETGLTGRSVELLSDGEPALHALFRAAARQENTPVLGLVFQTSAAQRHQQNGIAERAVQTFKNVLASNTFFSGTSDAAALVSEFRAFQKVGAFCLPDAQHLWSEKGFREHCTG